MQPEIAALRNMNWTSRLQTNPEVSLPSGGLAKQVAELFGEQIVMWSGLREGIEALDRAEIREIRTRGGYVIVQHNAQRIVSTTANVDDQAIKSRNCFLCPENMPAQERGIDFLGRYAILCNPFPVLPSHMVIASREHRPQIIRKHLCDLLELARALGEEFAVFYNGPACGASAPDHLHFQAALKDRLPLMHDFRHVQENACYDSKYELVTVEVRTLDDYRINVLVGESANAGALEDWFCRVMDGLGRVSRVTEPEPMINLMVEYGELYRITVFPRERHRPSAYYEEGAAKLTISPAAIDLAGVLVAPVAEDYVRLDSAKIEEIYADITISCERFRSLCNGNSWSGKKER